MMNRTRLLCLSSLCALMWTSEAEAANRTVCVKIDTDFDDSDLQSGEDYFEDNGPEVARGVRIHVINEVTSAELTGWADSTGCAVIDVPLGGANTYKLRVYANLMINGNEVIVRDSHNGIIPAYTLDTGNPMAWNPPTFTISGMADWWSIISVTGQALHRGSGGLTGTETTYFVEHNGSMQNLPASCGNDDCIDGADIYISPERAHLKFAVAYTMGWSLLHHMGAPSVNIDADDTHCGNAPAQSVRLNTVEYYSAAFTYGYAHWYSASAFNKTNEANCTYNYWKATNWDQLETCHKKLEAPASHVISCAASPGTLPMTELIPDRNYRGFCNKRSPGASLPPVTAVPFDYMRFLQDVVSQGIVTRSKVGDAMAEAVTDPSFDTFLAQPILKVAFVNQGMTASTFINEASEHGF